MSKAIAKKEKVLLPAGLDVSDLVDDAQDLNSPMSGDDLAQPFLMVIQSNSPELDEGDGKFIPDAKAGMFISKIDNQVYDGRETGLEIMTCAYERRFVEWKPRDQGGGRVQDYLPTDPIVRDIEWTDVGGSTKPIIPNGNLLIDTHYQFILFRPVGSDAEWQMAIMPCAGTKTKRSKALNSQISAERYEGKSMPRWFRRWELKTIREEADGNSWYNIVFTKGDINSEMDAYQIAKSVAEMQKVQAYDTTLAKEGAEDGMKTIDADEVGELPDDDMAL